MARYSKQVLDYFGNDPNLHLTEKFFGDIDTIKVTCTNPSGGVYDLTGATIVITIIRKTIENLVDLGRQGIDFDIFNYPKVRIVGTATASSASTNNLTITNKNDSQGNPLIFVGKPIQFWGNVFGNITVGTTYYVKTFSENKYISLSLTPNGPVFPLGEVPSPVMTMDIVSLLPNPITLPFTNNNPTTGVFLFRIDDSMWDLLAGDPDLTIDVNNPAFYTGNINVTAADGTWKRSYPLGILVRNNGAM